MVIDFIMQFDCEILSPREILNRVCNISRGFCW